MKTFIYSLRWLITMAFVMAAFISPELVFGGAVGVIGANTFITSSVTWEGKQNFDYFLKPLFIGKSPFDTAGFRVIPNAQSNMKLNYFGTAQKLLKAYVKGFNAVAGTTYTQRTLTVNRMKAEAADDATEFFQTVYEQGLKKGDWNDLTDTQLKGILVEIYQNALASDIFRQAWLNDTTHEDLTSGLINGTPDTDYNAYDGMWEMIFDNASTSPSATQIYRYASIDGAAAEVDTVTLTGSSGTCNVIIGGVNYLATFDTNLDTTHANFVALHATALAIRGITLTGTTTAVLTSANVGNPLPVTTVSAAVSGNLTGSKADTTPNTAPADLGAGESITILKDLWTNCPRVLKKVAKKEKVFYVAESVLDNYITYLESLGTEKANTMIIDGAEVYTYRGIPIINLGWDVYLDADFPRVGTANPANPHRVIYTALGNLILGIDAMNDFNSTRMWYNEDEEENRFRTKLIMGVNYVHNELMAVCY